MGSRGAAVGQAAVLKALGNEPLPPHSAAEQAVPEDSNASIFMVSSHTFLAVLTRSSENRSYVRSQLRRVSDGDHALSVVLPRRMSTRMGSSSRASATFSLHSTAHTPPRAR